MLSHTVDILVVDVHGGEIDRGLLATSELMHANAMDSAAARDSYLAARTWLRNVLAEYLGSSPSSIRLAGGQGAGDSIVAPVTDLHVSFSHTGGMAVLAVAFRREVGVAAKLLRDGLDMPERIGEELTVDELLKVARSHDPMRTLWKLAVRKRALAKSVGEELAAKANELNVGGISPIEHLGREIIDLYIADEVVAAVAVEPGTKLNLIIRADSLASADRVIESSAVSAA